MAMRAMAVTAAITEFTDTTEEMRATADTTWAMTLIKMPTEEKSEPTYRAVEPYSLEMMPSSVPLPPRRSRTA